MNHAKKMATLVAYNIYVLDIIKILINIIYNNGNITILNDPRPSPTPCPSLLPLFSSRARGTIQAVTAVY